MRIAVPVTNKDEIEYLALAGADEMQFSCFLQSQGVGLYTSKTSGHFIRGFGSWAELDEGVGAARRNGCSSSLLLDFKDVTDGDLPGVLATVYSFLDMGGGAVIARGLGLVGDLLELIPRAQIHVCALPECSFASTIWFCRQIGVSRLILPVGVTVADACEIAMETTDMEMQVFVGDLQELAKISIACVGTARLLVEDECLVSRLAAVKAAREIVRRASEAALSSVGFELRHGI